MKPLVIATHNAHKVQEIDAILRPLLPFEPELLSGKAFASVPDIVEDGTSFAENARKKAAIFAAHTGHMALADDSGLVVDALGGQPGVYSKRFAGPEGNDTKNNEKLLQMLADVKGAHRTARFVCVVALARPNSCTLSFTGCCDGLIAEKPTGDAGFGYDPLFYIPAYGQTLAELGPEVKNQISHRALAVKSAADTLCQWLSL